MILGAELGEDDWTIVDFNMGAFAGLGHRIPILGATRFPVFRLIRCRFHLAVAVGACARGDRSDLSHREDDQH